MYICGSVETGAKVVENCRQVKWTIKNGREYQVLELRMTKGILCTTMMCSK